MIALSTMKGHPRDSGWSLKPKMRPELKVISSKFCGKSDTFRAERMVRDDVNLLRAGIIRRKVDRGLKRKSDRVIKDLSQGHKTLSFGPRMSRLGISPFRVKIEMFVCIYGCHLCPHVHQRSSDKIKAIFMLWAEHTKTSFLQKSWFSELFTNSHVSHHYRVKYLHDGHH